MNDYQVPFDIIRAIDVSKIIARINVLVMDIQVTTPNLYRCKVLILESYIVIGCRSVILAIAGIYPWVCPTDDGIYVKRFTAVDITITVATTTNIYKAHKNGQDTKVFLHNFHFSIDTNININTISIYNHSAKIHKNLVTPKWIMKKETSADENTLLSIHWSSWMLAGQVPVPFRLLATSIRIIIRK